MANAGITHYGPFRDQPLDKALQMSQVNWHGTLHTVHFGAPPPARAGRGHIVVVSTGAGLRSFPQAAVYGATKAAQRMFAEALRHELGGHRRLASRPSIRARSPRRCTTTRRTACRPGTAAARSAAPPAELAEKIVAAIEDDERAVYYPALVRALGLVHGVNPKAGDALLRRLRGEQRGAAARLAAGARRRGGSVRSRWASAASPSRASPRNSREAGDSGALAREMNANVS